MLSSAPKSRADLKAAVNACVSKSNTQAFDCREYGNDLYTPISEWDVSDVTDMTDLFRDIKSFNADISKWDVSSVIKMHSMFTGATSFNADISKWNVSSVTSMQSMFTGASSFNADVSKWDVSSMTNMYQMFYNAQSFNVDISKWDASIGTGFVFKRGLSYSMFTRRPDPYASQSLHSPGLLGYGNPPHTTTCSKSLI